MTAFSIAPLYWPWEAVCPRYLLREQYQRCHYLDYQVRGQGGAEVGGVG